jgi:nitroimidazol reductase NimA-like FMN-containing flavoprotein (pyridoxamine 5'-phosphate oxidase superfamily)
MARLRPREDRPQMPGYGISHDAEGLLGWEWAEKRIRESHNYWLATTRPDGRPHVFPIWGVWLEDRFYFSAGRQSRKAANLRGNPYCVICNERAEEAVIIEGVAAELEDGDERRAVIAVYDEKYDDDLASLGQPIYSVQPARAFGLLERDFTGSATRWIFSAED